VITREDAVVRHLLRLPHRVPDAEGDILVRCFDRGGGNSTDNMPTVILDLLKETGLGGGAIYIRDYILLIYGNSFYKSAAPRKIL